MSVAFERSSSDSNRIQLPGFSNGMWIYNASDSTAGNPWSTRLPAVKEEEDSTTSSSIGNNSDIGGADSDDDDDDGQVQSKDNGLLNGLNDLEKVLPIKRGLSTFYAGKSKSYGSLADAVSVPSIQDIVKPEDAYSRKRKNMLAHYALLDKHHETTTTTESGVSKRFARNSEDSNDGSNTSTSMTGCSLPPFPCNSRKLSSGESSDSSPRLYMSSPWRSLSLSDLQHASSFTGVSSKGNEVDGH
ncbi:hypothetical protein L1987_29321 [Smallanthus sonchifolius]|uniref:Uncharacterized protein n=1 Tax=Smallanthus sonchifolius TaxID=185202 RepID=A0ACB9HZI8_9ASTR|nr:hypothetical protein L1987_29321 [Smallanthus sonchifolius]